MKPYTRQSVNSLLTYDHDIRDLSNQSFVFNELNHEIVLCVAFDPDGEEIVAGGQTGTVKVFNLKARNERLCLTGHKEAVNTVSFSPNGNFGNKRCQSLRLTLIDRENAHILIFRRSHDLHRIRRRSNYHLGCGIRCIFGFE